MLYGCVALKQCWQSYFLSVLLRYNTPQKNSNSIRHFLAYIVLRYESLKHSKVDDLLKKLLHEPLLHFLLLGGLLFLFYSFSQHDENTENSIVISKGRIEQLTSDWEKKFFRTPTKEEKQKMIENEIYQTVLYREALKIGLDKNDDEIKRRLAQKMEFVAYDTYELPLPSDEVLKKFMREHPEKYKEEGKIHFTQNMVGSDTTEFEKEYTLTKFEAGNIFGRPFAEVLFTLKPDGKVHKIESTYGVHEVRVIERPIEKPKAFDTVKEKLKDDYLSLQREQKNRAIYEKLKSQYNISIEEK